MDKNGKFYWVMSESHIDEILKIRTRSQSNFSELDMIDEVLRSENKINILSGEPSIGKSVSMSYLAQQFQLKNFWVEKINLINLCSSFESKETFDDQNACISFLINKVMEIPTKFGKEVFRHKLDSVILLMDGLDEISPFHKEKCVKWILGLSQSAVKQILVSTRPHLQTEMENLFCSIAYTLATFSEPEKVEYLLKIWKESPEIEKFLDVDKRKVATQLIEQISKAFAENKNSVLLNPLLLSMIAEIFKEQVELQLKNASKIEFNEPLSLAGFYKSFVYKVHIRKLCK
jgi:predicted NACHT family NTPase